MSIRLLALFAFGIVVTVCLSSPSPEASMGVLTKHYDGDGLEPYKTVLAIGGLFR